MIPGLDLDQAAASRERQKARTKKPTEKRARKQAKQAIALAQRLARHTQARGVRRYALFVPQSKREIALAIGAKQENGYWFIDNPTSLEDIAAWKPRLLNFEAVKQEILSRK